MKYFLLAFFWSFIGNASEPFVGITSSCDEEKQKIFMKEFRNLDPQADCYTFCVIKKSSDGTGPVNSKCFPTSYETAHRHKEKVNAVIRNVFNSTFDDIFSFAGKSDTTLESLVTYLDKYKNQACNVAYNELEKAKDRYNSCNRGLQCEKGQTPRQSKTSGKASQ